MSLVCQYLFNDNGNSETGKYNLTSLGTSPVYVSVPSCYKFQGKLAQTSGLSNQGLYCSLSGASGELYNVSQATISFWARLADNTSSNHFVATIDYYTSSRAWQIFNYYRFSAFTNQSSGASQLVSFGLNSLSKYIQKIRHYVVQKTSTYIQLWVDGKKTNSISFTTDFLGGASGRLQFFRYPLDSNVCFKGEVGDFRIYNHALTDNEIIQLYKDGACVEYYEMLSQLLS